MRILKTFLILVMMAASAFAGDVPVYGPARVGVEDPDLLADTVLDVGVLAVSSWDLSRVFIGDGITPGGIEIHPKGCVRGFEDVATATTNLSMKTYAITFQSWKMSGDLNEFDFTWGGQESWMRFVRDTGDAYLSYNFSCTEHEYTFDFSWTGAEGEPLPELQVTTNLMEGFAVAPTNATVYTRPDVSHVRIVYTREDVPACIFFRVFAQSRMSTGIYFDEPVVATAGIKMGTNTWSAWPDLSGIAANAATAAVSPVEARIGTLETNAASHATKTELADATNTLAGAVSATYATSAALGAVAGQAATNAGNIFSNAAALTAITNALGQRVSEFETVHIGYAPTTQTNEKFWVPTNLPTRSLTLHFNADKYTSTNYAAYVFITNGWRPSKPVTITIVLDYASTAAVRFRTGIGTSQRTDRAMSSGAIYHYIWIPEGYGQWELLEITTGTTRIYSTNGDSGNVGWYMSAQNLPHTIEDWVAWRSQQRW